MITRGWCDAPSAPPSPLLRWCAMGSTNRERLTSALTDGRATRVVMRLGVAIELIIGFTLLVIPDVVIRALIAADGGTTSTIVGRVLGGALIGLGIAGASARGHTPERRIVLAYVVYNVSAAAILAAAGVAGTASGILLCRWLQCTRFWRWLSSPTCY